MLDQLQGVQAVSARQCERTVQLPVMVVCLTKRWLAAVFVVEVYVILAGPVVAVVWRMR